MHFIFSNDSVSASYSSALSFQSVMNGLYSSVVHACDHCNAVFSHPMLLKSHTLRHGEKTVMCHRCGRKFFTQKQLNSHEVYQSVSFYFCKDFSISHKSKLT